MNITIILIILLAGSLVTFLSGNRFASKIALLFSGTSVVFSVALLISYLQHGVLSYSVEWISNPSVRLSFKADGLALAMLLMTTVLLTVIICSRFTHPDKKERYFYSLVLFSAFSIVGVFLSSNGLLYYVFWEMSLIPIYFIIIYWGNGEASKRRKATMTFFVYTFAGSLFMLAAFIYMYQKTGSFELEDLYKAGFSFKEQIWIFLAFFIAYAIKVPIFPFHTWQASVYQKAPAVGTMILSALMSKMGLYSIIRWQIPISPLAAHYLQTVVVSLCIFSVLYGTIISLRQDNLKRLFAFASLAHVSFIAAGAYALTVDGLDGAVLLIIAHGVGIVGLFFAAEVIYRRWNTASIAQMGGIRSQASLFYFLFFVMILGSIAIPLTFNFIGEFTIMYGLYQVNIWYSLFIGLSMFLSAFLMLRMFQHVMLGEPKRSFADLQKSETVVYLVLVIITIVFGLSSAPISELVAPSLREILFYING